MLVFREHIKLYRVSSACVAVIPTIGLPQLPELAPIMTQCVRNLLWAIANLQTAFMLCFHCCLMSRSLSAAFAAQAFSEKGLQDSLFLPVHGRHCFAICCAVLSRAVLCCAVPCCAVLCCAMPCHITFLATSCHAMPVHGGLNFIPTLCVCMCRV